MNSVTMIGYFGILLRLNSLKEKGIEFQKIVHLMDDGHHEENDSLAIFSPIFGKEAMEELSKRLIQIGLEYFDDFYELEFSYPDWCKMKFSCSDE